MVFKMKVDIPMYDVFLGGVMVVFSFKNSTLVNYIIFIYVIKKLMIFNGICRKIVFNQT